MALQSMERPFSLYADLRVPPDAPPAAIEGAYRRLMKRYHPDHAGPEGATEAAAINAAYAVLRSSERRAAYDRREHARRQAIFAVEAQSFERRRRIVRGGSWLAAAVALGAGIPLGANWYNHGIVPQRSAAVAAVPAEEPAAAIDSRDPVEQMSDFLAKASIGRPALNLPPPPKPAARAPVPARVAAAGVEVAPVRLRRSVAREAPRPSQSAAAEADFLEREGYIY